MISIENQKNTICIGFQFHNPKLSQEGCFKTNICCASLCVGCPTKKAIDSFFSEALYRKSLNTICIVFPIFNPKLSQEWCFKPYVYYIKLLQDALRKKQLITTFVEHFEENHENLVSGCFQFYIPKLSQQRCFIPYLLYDTMYRAQDAREATNSFFRRAFERKDMETLKESFFSLMSINLITKSILDFLTAAGVYAQDVLRKKQMKISWITLRKSSKYDICLFSVL